MNMRSKTKYMLLTIIALGTLQRAKADVEKKLFADDIKQLGDTCHDGDGSTCIKYARFVGEELNQWTTYYLVIKYGCEKKRNKESCAEMREVTQQGLEYEKKCNKKSDAESCRIYGIGQIHMYGNKELGIQYMEKACKLNHEPACTYLKKAN